MSFLRDHACRRSCSLLFTQARTNATYQLCSLYTGSPTMLLLTAVTTSLSPDGRRGPPTCLDALRFHSNIGQRRATEASNSILWVTIPFGVQYGHHGLDVLNLRALHVRMNEQQKSTLGGVNRRYFMRGEHGRGPNLQIDVPALKVNAREQKVGVRPLRTLFCHVRSDRVDQLCDLCGGRHCWHLDLDDECS